MSSVLNNNVVKNSSNLNFSNFERFNRVLSFLELPFFFDNDSNKFYRFEGSIYNFNYEITYRNFSVDLNLGLKVKTKLLMSLFMQLPSPIQTFDGKFSLKTSFLLNNGFISNNVNFNNLIKSSNNDYFSVSSVESHYKKLFNVSLELSDVSLNLLAPRNKFNRVTEFNMSDIDTFISTVNANWIDLNNLDVSFHNNSLRSLTVVNDNLRTFSFLVSSLDGFKVLHSQFFNKYLYFKKVKQSIKAKSVGLLFTFSKNKLYYLFFYNNLIKTTDTFLFKNLNYLYIYNYVAKFLLFFIVNYKSFFLQDAFTVKYAKYIFIFVVSNFFLENASYNSMSARSSFVLKKSALGVLKQFIMLFNLSTNATLNRPFVSSTKLLSNKKKAVVSTSVFFPLNFSRILARNYKKCYHKHSLHYQPSEIFSAVSRLGYTATSIAYMTSFTNLKTYHYTEKSITSYYSFLKFFSDFILSFFKRNFVNSVLINNYYDPKYLLYRYFSTFKLFFPIIFKRWILNNLNTSIDFSLISNYLNYSLITKKTLSLKYKKNKIQKKRILRSKFNKVSKIMALKAPNIFKNRVRFYTTITNVTKTNNFSKIINVFVYSLFGNLNYYDCNLFFLNSSKLFNNNNIKISSYFFYLMFRLFTINKVFAKYYNLNNTFFIIDYKLLSLLELIKSNISINLFNKKSNAFFLRYNDFNIKIDFYTFIILKRYIEYFRCFKYNEYLSYSNISNLNLYVHFSKPTNEFTFLPAFFEFKRAVFFNKYLVFKFYNNKKNVELNEFTIDFFLTTSFFKFFLIIISVKKIFNIFFHYFYMYIVSNVHYYIYISLLNSAREFQLVSINSLNKVESQWKNKLSLFEIISFNTKKYLQQSFLNNYAISNYIVAFGFSNIKNKLNLFIDTVNFLLVDYIDNIVLSRLLELHTYKTVNILEFLKSMILRKYFTFIDLNFINDLVISNVLFLKFKLDFFLWSIYNFSFILNYNIYYLNDILLFVNKFIIDSNNNLISDRFSNFLNLCYSSLNMVNFFFMYIVARDYTLKLLSRLFIYSFFCNLYFIYLFLNYFKFIQFLKLKFQVTQLKYYRLFNVFYTPNFKFLI